MTPSSRRVFYEVIIFFVGSCSANYQCPSGWAESGDYCYHLSNAAYSYNTSRQVCRNFGGDLMAQNSVEEKARELMNGSILRPVVNLSRGFRNIDFISTPRTQHREPMRNLLAKMIYSKNSLVEATLSPGFMKRSQPRQTKLASRK